MLVRDVQACNPADRNTYHGVEKNGLFFIETSALDATNVDKAFETILSGSVMFPHLSPSHEHM